MNTLTTAPEQQKSAGQRAFADVMAAALITAGRPRSAEYRALAAECQGIADRWSDLAKQQYEELARQWLVLAERAEG